MRHGSLFAPRRAAYVLHDAPTDDLLQLAQGAVGDLKQLVEVDDLEHTAEERQVGANRLRRAEDRAHARAGDHRDRDPRLFEREEDAEMRHAARTASTESQSELPHHHIKANPFRPMVVERKGQSKLCQELS